MAIDLHIHSTYSDGTFTPEQLVLLARDKGLRAIALTDHDITDGNEEALFYGEKYGVSVIPGVELSIDCSLPNNGHLHMLGLFINHSDESISGTLRFLREERGKRNEKILKILTDMNMPVTMDELLAEAGEGSVGRPHIAMLMLKHGYAQSIQEAFDRFLKKGAPAYMEKVKLDPEKGIKLIKDSGGMAILAHPALLGFKDREEITAKIMELHKIGLDGIEVYYSSHSKNFSKWLGEFAVQNELAISGGSDFHGNNKPDIKMGTGRGKLHVPDTVYENLVKAYNSKS